MLVLPDEMGAWNDHLFCMIKIGTWTDHLSFSFLSAECCKDYKNFNSMFAIMSGLRHGSVSRLRSTWEKLPNKYCKMFEVSPLCSETVPIVCNPFLSLSDFCVDPKSWLKVGTSCGSCTEQSVMRHQNKGLGIVKHLMKEHPGKRPPWWQTALMTDHPDDRPPWQETTLMRDLPDWRAPWWETTLMINHPDDRPPWWESLLLIDHPMRDCPDKRESWWDTTLMMDHPDERPLLW